MANDVPTLRRSMVMEIMETVWPVVAAAIGIILLPGAALVITLTPPNYAVARLLLSISVVILGATDLVWQLTTDKPAWFRLAAASATAFAAFVLCPILRAWTRDREARNGAP
jgi:hypothetical protein